MKLFVFGASGMAGQALVQEALRRGRQVTAAARDISKAAAAPGMTLEQVDAGSARGRQRMTVAC